MKQRLLVLPILLACLLLAQGVFADSMAIKAGDTIQKILEAHKGKRITLA